MPWVAKIANVGRDNQGNLSLTVDYREAGQPTVQATKQFVFEPTSTRQTVVAEIRSFGLKEEERRKAVDDLVSRFQLGQEFNV
jgi:hypothetical protein